MTNRMWRSLDVRWVPLALAVAFLVVGLSADRAHAQQLAGQRVKVKAVLDGEALVAARVQPRDPRRSRNSGRLSGTVSRIDRETRTIEIGPAIVRWTDATEFAGLTERDLRPGVGLEIRVRKLGDLLASRIEPDDSKPGDFEILGTITLARGASDGSQRVSILGIPVEFPADLVMIPLSLFRDPDNRRPSDQFSTTVAGLPLVVGGEVSARVRHRSGAALDNREEDDRSDLGLELQLEFYSEISPHTSAYAEFKASHDADLHREGGGTSNNSEVERGETWIYTRLGGDSGFALQVGRQAFREPREWWWDDDLDGIRVYWNHFPVSLELGVAQELARVSTDDHGIDPEQDEILRVLGRAGWRILPDHELSAFVLRQSDRSARPGIGDLLAANREDDSDADLVWFGLRASGDAEAPGLGPFDYWLDVARVQGRELRYSSDEVAGGLRIDGRTRNRVRGWAFDTGLTFQLDLPLDPSFTLGYAFGSGDDEPGDATDTRFRQTGLQDNNARFRGVDRFRYYGELLDPELSNLHITTVSVGVPILQSSSAEFVFHHYRQEDAATRLRSDLDARPGGTRRTIGQELDLVLGLEEWEQLEIEIVGSIFRSGSAFERLSGEFAYGGFIRMDWNF